MKSPAAPLLFAIVRGLGFVVIGDPVFVPPFA